MSLLLIPFLDRDQSGSLELERTKNLEIVKIKEGTVSVESPQSPPIPIAQDPCRLDNGTSVPSLGTLFGFGKDDGLNVFCNYLPL